MTISTRHRASNNNGITTLADLVSRRVRGDFLSFLKALTGRMLIECFIGLFAHSFGLIAKCIISSRFASEK